MTLDAFLTGLPALRVNAGTGLTVGRLCMDSRAVKPGDTFVAIEGLTVDGHNYIQSALENGASLVFSQKPLPDHIPHVQFENVSLASLACRFFQNPSQKLIMTGITGTNGKTTVTHILYEMLVLMGFKTGLIGTNRIMIGGTELPAERTTPDALEIQTLLARMVEEGCTHCVMEVSSHALELGRVEHIRYKTAGFTNLSQDHLDFHADMESYYIAKRKLFGRSDNAVLNLLDQSGRRLDSELDIPRLTFSIDGQASLTASDCVYKSDRVCFNAAYAGNSAAVTWHTPGRFSVENALTALGCALSLGLPFDEAARTMSAVPPVKGRLEPVPYQDGISVLIDYAHTPDGLLNVLTAARDFTSGRLITVFGCGGNRDRDKRPKMGSIASRMSDITMVTSDNPRDEPPQKIIDQILVGCEGDPLVVLDRREAIGQALSMALPGDVVLLCGKGHETYQEISGRKHHMDEREIVDEYRRKTL